MDNFDRVGHWLYKVTGFALEVFAILVLAAAFQVRDFQAGLVAILMALVLSLSGLGLILFGDRLGSRERP